MSLTDRRRPPRAHRSGATSPRWSARIVLLTGAAVALAVWICLLPTLVLAEESLGYRTAWVALDLAELGALLTTVGLALRRHRRAGVAALVAAGLLVLDAVADVGTSSEVGMALAMAFGAELPLAAVCVAEAHNHSSRTAPDTSEVADPHPRVGASLIMKSAPCGSAS